MGFNKEDMAWNLEGLIKDVAGQTDEKWRWKYFGEAISIIKAMVLIGWFTTDEANEFKCQLKAAFNSSLQIEGACDSGDKPQKNWDVCPKNRNKCEQCKAA